MKRNASLDVFRCMLMLLIVMYHAAAYGLHGGDGAPVWVGLAFGAFIIWHVDGFVALSGWFGIRFSISRFMKIWGLILFYSLISFAYAKRFSFTGGWFGGAYLMLMFMAPLLNAAVDALAKCDLRKRWMAWGVFTTGIVLNSGLLVPLSVVRSGCDVFSC